MGTHQQNTDSPDGRSFPRPTGQGGDWGKFKSRLMIGAACLGGICLIVWGVVWLVEHPSSAAYKILLNASALTLRTEQTETDEYLIFMGEDSPANRRHLLSTSPDASYLGESFFPGVFVVRINEKVAATLDALRAQTYVKMVFKYDPSFGCH